MSIYDNKHRLGLHMGFSSCVSAHHPRPHKTLKPEQQPSHTWISDLCSVSSHDFSASDLHSYGRALDNFWGFAPNFRSSCIYFLDTIEKKATLCHFYMHKIMHKLYV